MPITSEEREALTQPVDSDIQCPNPKLQNLLELGHSPNPESTQLEKAIIRIIVESIDPTDAALEMYFRDLAYGGCASGHVSQLIYTRDAQRFYFENYDDIEDLRTDWESDVGQPLHPGGSDLANYYAWFAFEEVARALACKVGIEI